MSGSQSYNPTVREIGRSNGRVLGVCEYGDPEGFPVLAFHGIPGTRLMFRPTHEIARRLGLRIIAPDRPGFGCSTPQPQRTLQDWPPDVDAILNAYEIDRFSLVVQLGNNLKQRFGIQRNKHFPAFPGFKPCDTQYGFEGFEKLVHIIRRL